MQRNPGTENAVCIEKSSSTHSMAAASDLYACYSCRLSVGLKTNPAL